MATPIGHALAGYSIYLFSEAGEPPRRRDKYKLVLLATFMAVAPDLDFLPGLLVGAPALYHQGISHSLGAALLVSIVAAASMRFEGRGFFRVFGISFLSYVSHLVIDFFGPDGRWPYGIPVFWPLSGEYFLSPTPLFLGMHHAGSTDASILEWIRGILSFRNVLAVGVEVAWTAPFVLVGQWYTRHRGKRRASI